MSKTPTKAEMAITIRDQAALIATLKAQLAAQRASNSVPRTEHSRKRPPYATVFDKDAAFRMRASMAKANFLDHPWCVEAVSSPRGTVYLVY